MLKFYEQFLTKGGKMKKILLLIIISLICLGDVGISLAGSQDFTLINKTGIEIKELFISPHQSNEWEKVLPEEQSLPDGEKFEVVFEERKETYWDLMIINQDGHKFFWNKINLKEITRIILYYDGKKVWAEID